jgi:hypothetical protein
MIDVRKPGDRPGDNEMILQYYNCMMLLSIIERCYVMICYVMSCGVRIIL